MFPAEERFSPPRGDLRLQDDNILRIRTYEGCTGRVAGVLQMSLARLSGVCHVQPVRAAAEEWSSSSAALSTATMTRVRASCFLGKRRVRVACPCVFRRSRHQMTGVAEFSRRARCACSAANPKVT